MSDEIQKPQWFTIKQAAEYLDVGEPTLYRWMRDNRITFRKVGDSTRFLQEDLDAMVRVHPSAKDLDRVTAVCPACNHTELAPGRMQSTGLLYFRPNTTKFWTFRTGDISTEARMCTRCGHISLVGDTAKLAALRETTKDPKAKAAADDAADAAS